MESNTASELDLALLNALQVSPRADWQQVGTALGVSAATVARRWDSLHGRGLAWVGLTMGHRRSQEIASAFALVTCVGDPKVVAARLAREREVATIARTMGSHDLLLDILVHDLESLRRYLAIGLARIEGVGAVVSYPITTIFTTGSRWRVRALEPNQVRQLSGGALPGSPRFTTNLDRLDHQLIGALTEDARLSWTELATQCATSAPTARRRIQRLFSSGVIELRCELATPLVGPAIQVTFFLQLPSPSIQEAGKLIAAMSKCRLAASVVDRSNLVATMWFSSPAEIEPFEALLLSAFPQLAVNERIVHLHPVKRIGHLLDAQDRATGEVVPLAAW
ncbi:Lrp/AsnC family transcriptional regulator [Arthrobacter sp. A2-55]|uniref:Lrp/AsnC family transcriptional regulator n=1 Tax=Arthrobacter sp. A2-55 TaxID=2897337 RepID=UPI0021CD37F9|nr:Lrp/AsnC family transcriptional regulator [Arthrobacter sp. A2-55]MCU6479971.1 Lrp/AsnC family transcriptional regulator [Arthrobacter sp. A2-55]